MAKKPKITAQEFPAPPLPPVDAPVPFSRIYGQPRAIGLLEQAIKSGRIHHCWIFHGPRGVGKFRAALAFAGMLLDPTLGHALTGELCPDPESQVQRLLRAGIHPDLHVVFKELAKYDSDKRVRDKKLLVIPKEVISRRVIEPASMAPNLNNQSLASKVFIVDEAELLDKAPQNALLKTLEEPPERTVIILITDNLSVLYPTIRSRAQQVSFSPLGEGAMRQWLSEAPGAASEEETRWLVEFSGGSPGTFVAAQKAGVFGWWEGLSPHLEAMGRGRSAVDAGATMAGLAEAYAGNWVKEFPHLSKEAANRQGADWVIRLVGYWLRRQLRNRMGGDTTAVLLATEAIREAERAADANTNIGFVMEKLAGEIVGAFAGESQFVA